MIGNEKERDQVRVESFLRNDDLCILLNFLFMPKKQKIKIPETFSCRTIPCFSSIKAEHLDEAMKSKAFATLHYVQ